MGKKKIITIVGARPQIIKASAISRAIRLSFQDVIHEVIVHTGQHYDQNMSQIFSKNLGYPIHRTTLMLDLAVTENKQQK